MKSGFLRCTRGVHHGDYTRTRGSMKEVKYKSYDELPLMLSIPEVATVLGISRAGAYELARNRGVPSLSIGSRILVPKDKLIAWIEAQCAPNK